MTEQPYDFGHPHLGTPAGRARHAAELAKLAATTNDDNDAGSVFSASFPDPLAAISDDRRKNGSTLAQARAEGAAAERERIVALLKPFPEWISGSDMDFHYQDGWNAAVAAVRGLT